MRKLNTHQFYRLAKRIHPLTELKLTEPGELSGIFFPLLMAANSLEPYTEIGSIFPPSSRRAAGQLVEAIRSLGVTEEVSDDSDFHAIVQPWQVSSIAQKAKDLETVLSNDLPGLDTYYVSRKGIYSTSALIDNAELAIIDGLSEEAQTLLTPECVDDFKQAGRCLAFELPTAAGFHCSRAVESMLRAYWRSAKGIAERTKAPEMAQCINEIRAAGEDKKVLDILDHLRDLHRNTLMHPDAFLNMREALRLFDISKSAISAMAERINAIETAAAHAAAAASGD